MVGGISLPRMIIGTNWFLGFSHTSVAKDEYIRQHVMERKKIADILEVFFRSGINAVIGMAAMPPLVEAVREAQDRTGVEGIIISSPHFPVGPETPSQGLDESAVARVLDEQAALGTKICMPHQMTTDALLDRCTRKIRHMEVIMRMTRERGMVPGLSTHMPETIIYADESGLDTETYISIYNSAGFLMQLEVDWTGWIISQAKKPVLTIKPMAAGQVRPFQAMAFVWSTIRDQDMVAVGTMSPKEAEELIYHSNNILEKRNAMQVQLQETRSKNSVKPKKSMPA
jgi:hypothetical protein